MPAFDNEPIERDAIYWEHEGNRAIRMGQWKLVAKGPAGKWELYDMENDRTEMHDLASAEPERVKGMTAKWEAWAKRDHVLPWPWNPPYGAPPETQADVGSRETHFVLKEGDDLSRRAAPRIAGRGFTITAQVSEMAPNGVIIAQGGSAEGFALYLKDGRLIFATRVGGQLSVVTAKGPLPKQPVKLTARLETNGIVQLSADGHTIAKQETSGTLRRMPIDGLQVGRDAKGAVGDYETPFAFGGKLGQVVLELE